MKHPFEHYKKVADDVARLLIKNDCSAYCDIDIIYNMLMNFPYCMDSEGHYTYGGKMYDDPRDMPEEAKKQLLHHYQRQLSVFDFI